MVTKKCDQRVWVASLTFCFYGLGGMLHWLLFQPETLVLNIGIDIRCKKLAPALDFAGFGQHADAVSAVPLELSSHLPFIAVTVALLSTLPIFASGREQDPFKINLWCSLGLGHATTFVTAQMLKHGLSFMPDAYFYEMCHLSFAQCVRLRHQNMSISEGAKESNSNQTMPLHCVLPKFHQHLYTEPNVHLCLLATSATTFCFNLCLFLKMSSQTFCSQTAVVKITILISLFLFLSCLTMAAYENGLNHIVSVGHGVLVQCFYCFLFV